MAGAAGSDTSERQRRLLVDHYLQHGTIPSMAGLARLWSYASKSSAARQVDRLIASEVLVWSADRRLAPGPAFPAETATIVGGTAPRPEEGSGSAKILDEAQAAWSIGYDPEVARSYAMTARLLRVARSMERGMARSAAAEGLTSGDVLLLDALFRAGPPHRIRPTALKRYFLLSLAGVGKRVERLEQRGYIAKVPDSGDRRGLFVELTGSGQSVLARLVANDHHAPHIVWPLALSSDEYQSVARALARAEELIGRVDPGENDRSAG